MQLRNSVRWAVVMWLCALFVGCKPKTVTTTPSLVLAAASTNSDLKNWLAHPHNIGLVIYAPPNTPEMLSEGGLRWYSPKRLQTLLEKSSRCLNNAFQVAGYSNARFAFQLQSFTHLSVEDFAKLPTEPWDLPFDHTGEFLSKRGCDTENFPVYFSRKVSQPIYVNPNDPNAVARAHAWVQIRNCLEGIESPCGGELEGLSKSQIEERMIEYAKNVHLKSPPAAALLYANPVFTLSTSQWGDALSGKMTEDDVTAMLLYEDVYFVHEFLHVYGGLDDRYHNPDYYDQTNIMGNTEEWTCKLAADQVAAIYEFRKNCKKEQLEQREPLTPP